MSHAKKVSQLISTLTIEEKVGQLFVLAFAGEDTEYALQLVKDFHVGGFYITDDNARSLTDAKKLSTKLQEQAALRSCDAPLLLAVDQEGAWGILTHETDLGPGNLALGKANDLALTESMYQVFAQQMQSIGYNTLLSPCVDVNSNPKNPIIGQRSFGETAELVASHTESAVKGIIKTGNLACAKHFPGHGDTAIDSHRTLSHVDKSLASLITEDLLPFQKAIDAGVSLVMTAHIRYPQIDSEHPATLSRKILTDILKNQMNFNGLIITDSMNMWAMRKHYSPAQAAIMAIKAGAHLVMLSEEHYENEATPYKQIQQETIQGVINAVKTGDLDEQLLDETLQHVLCFKYRDLETHWLTETLDTNTCKLIAQSAADKAVKVIRNTKNLLPLMNEPFYLTFAANPALYEKLINSRGIGPNDPIPASEVFTESLREIDATFTTIPYFQFSEVLAGQKHLSNDQPIVIVTEDYPLPGEDFYSDEQVNRVINTQQLFGDRVIVLSLRSDYELVNFNDINTYVCAFSSRSVSAKSLAKIITC
ncbi:glycoside hydrolase family 3 protein [Colwellia sp. 1_MG-2023]|uniref:glycoside hydrolase family 3 protein n=1 Tax=Colwellia sp. 1_MG-2023 TaxID=3062649 RepID=UPI0026E4740D|nr:glycoside hydrolase family 3 protein [Colwellia sp. 1_MG-2023]MDO6447138.1 glycoside hydrolase family 3 protein [Colwellia sp. 1_MG-2023]